MFKWFLQAACMVFLQQENAQEGCDKYLPFILHGDGGAFQRSDSIIVLSMRPTDRLTGERISVGFCQDGTKIVDRDEWTVPPSNLSEPKKLWRGWTLLRMKDVASSSTSDAAFHGGEVSSSTSRRFLDGVVEVPYAVWSAANEQLWNQHGQGSEGPLPEESRVVRSPNFEDFPPGLGYVQDTVKNKGISL